MRWPWRGTVTPPEQNVRIQEQKARTIAEGAGKSKKEIEAAVKAAGEKSAKKLRIR
jgi:hypothetical protein